jgi:benzil reductase ((S)-benzoin forming)
MKNIYIVTGTSRGLGHALMKELSEAHKGNQVFCIQREMGKETIKNAIYVKCDLSLINELPNVMDSIFNEIDLQKVQSITLINNAGVLSPIKPIHDSSIAEISNNIDVNLKAVIILTSIFIQKTQELDINKMVINISSGAAVKPYDGWSVYCAAKAGVDLFTRSVGLEQSRQKFPTTIFSFYPGVINTGMQKLIRESDKDDFPTVQKFVDYKENGDLLSAEFVAKTLLNHASSNDIENGEIYNIRNMI